MNVFQRLAQLGALIQSRSPSIAAIEEIVNEGAALAAAVVPGAAPVAAALQEIEHVGNQIANTIVNVSTEPAPAVAPVAIAAPLPPVVLAAPVGGAAITEHPSVAAARVDDSAAAVASNPTVGTSPIPTLPVADATNLPLAELPADGMAALAAGTIADVESATPSTLVARIVELESVAADHGATVETLRQVLAELLPIVQNIAGRFNAL